jgi:hypothetical protein
MTNWEEKYNEQLQLNQQLQSASTNNINTLISQASSSIACGPDCQKQKISDNLKTQLLNAKSNLQSAPDQLKSAFKKYFVFTKGESGYIEQIKTDLEKEATTISEKFYSNLDTKIQEVKTLISTYDGLLLNFMHVFELYRKYKKENVMLEYKLKNTTSDILTNDRKTYYEEQGIDTLKFWYKIIFGLYAIVILAFIISSFINSNNSNKFVKFGIVILLIIYPYFATQILSYIITKYNDFLNILPNNAYKNI